MLSNLTKITQRSFSFTGFKPQTYTGISYENVRKSHDKYIMPFFKPYFKEPFLAVQGRGQYLYDDKGDQYLDLIGGISTVGVGHCHPRLTKIYADQFKKLGHISAIYFNQHQGQYAKLLCQSLGQGFQSVYLCNSGSQANDFAYLLARLYTGSDDVYSLRNAYHGISGNAYSLCGQKTWNAAMPKYSVTQKLQWPNFYRKPHLTIDQLIQDADEQMSASSNGKIAAFWIQHIQAAGGIVDVPPQYAQKMYKLVKRYNGLYVSDQVHTGFGRIGKKFWGFKHMGVKPDIVVIAKSMCNGFPMGAVVTSNKIMSAFNHNFFNTYGGGALQCRLASEVLKIIEDQKLADNSEMIGNYLKEQLLRLQKKSKVIGDVRGRASMIGVQIVEDKQSRKPAPHIALQIMQDFKKERILIAKSGMDGNVLRVSGTFILTKDNIKKTIQVLEHSLQKYE